MAAKRSNLLIIASAVLGLVLLAGMAYRTRDRSLTGINDFVQLYVGATLLGEPGLYVPETNAELQLATIGVHLESVYYSRLPFYALLLKPLTWLPYQTAYLVYQFLRLLALAGFLWMMAKAVPELVLLASLSVPLFSTFVAGQDLTFVLFFAAASLALAARGRDLPAGLMLSMCLIKPHLFVLVPIAMIAHRRWRFAVGAAVGTIIWLIGSTIAAGPGWAASYIALLRNPVLHPRPDIMPNLHGLVYSLGGSPAIEIVLSVVVVLLYGYFAFRCLDFELAFGIALVGGLLLSFHSYTQDSLVLLLTYALIAAAGRAKPLRVLTALAITPPIYALPFSAAVPAALLILLFAAAGIAVTETAAPAERPVGLVPEGSAN